MLRLCMLTILLVVQMDIRVSYVAADHEDRQVLGVSAQWAPGDPISPPLLFFCMEAAFILSESAGIKRCVSASNNANESAGHHQPTGRSDRATEPAGEAAALQESM